MNGGFFHNREWIDLKKKPTILTLLKIFQRKKNTNVSHRTLTTKTIMLHLQPVHLHCIFFTTALALWLVSSSINYTKIKNYTFLVLFYGLIKIQFCKRSSSTIIRHIIIQTVLAPTHTHNTTAKSGSIIAIPYILYTHIHTPTTTLTIFDLPIYERRKTI